MIVAPYDGSYAPPAIVLPVIVEGTVTGRSAVMGMFIDVLSEQTVLALTVVDELGLTLFGESAITDPDGQRIPAPSYFATIWIGDRAYWCCAAGYGDTSYVGRDILDQLDMRLDGPQQRLYVSLGNAL